MVRGSRLDVLLALLGTSPAAPVGGGELTRRLALGGIDARPSRLLRDLLVLEESGHVVIDRPAYDVGLSPMGESAAYDLGPGAAVEVLVLMVDLVGFVAFTEEHGDQAALDVATRLNEAAALELTGRSGRPVKQLGDGVLGALPPDAEPLEAVVAIADRLRAADDRPWALRAAARVGRPIAHNGDLFGADVNLVARLCAEAAPDELVVALDDTSSGGEVVQVRGIARDVPIERRRLR